MIIYTDGSAHPNPGPGGFGVIALDNNEKILSIHSEQFSDRQVTNNEMEIRAILYSLLQFGKNINEDFLIDIPILYSDSQYCVNIFNDWMFRWANNNWIKSNKQIPENLDLIKSYYNYYQKGNRIDIQWVKGHGASKWNNYVDLLATGKITEEKILEKESYI